MKRRLLFSLVGLLFLSASTFPALAADLADGFYTTGYIRTGVYTKPSGLTTGGYTLGGDLQKFRLGNEGDNYFEIGIGVKHKIGDAEWGCLFMPAYWSGDGDSWGEIGVRQLYLYISDLSFAPGATFWVGPRYHRLVDFHIVDHFLITDDEGNNLGAGVDDINVGLGKLNVSVYSSNGLENNHNGADVVRVNDASRVNVQWHDIPVNPGGKLTVTGAVIDGTFDQGSSGGALGLWHSQKFSKELTNNFFLQGSTGHANIEGGFYNLDSRSSSTDGSDCSLVSTATSPDGSTQFCSNKGADHQYRIADGFNWQYGPFGGQALVGYQTVKLDDGVETKDFSLGGRASYAITDNFKMLLEASYTSRDKDGMDTQRLTKVTFAPTLALKPGFWARPELRFYISRVDWNDAAAADFGDGTKTSATLFGIQLETWW